VLRGRCGTAARNLEVPRFTGRDRPRDISRILIDKFAVIEKVCLNLHAMSRRSSGVLNIPDDRGDSVVLKLLDIRKDKVLGRDIRRPVADFRELGLSLLHGDFKHDPDTRRLTLR